ncbi:MAG: hypothetical protein K2I24_06265 [Duncaniella sp.]|jgi:NifB/MoaA-like Fe-S oxidoreductase|uniref:hypothetical protein n=1 Tax=Duncaniella muricolitica TaxID=2880704 RepID=UPI000F46675C|nr:hypothetical protein [Duncaniella muricolitica]MCX4369328.1 hypothetical protein [Duncaniella sp.]MDE5669121.1 hypothetical protein [Duncaniella sp.]MDE6204561.1 hypothetical protein [Duncaniella sp.]ROT20584.1 hypothetical protein EEL51_05640 [Muribaculaceae bacterium Isolate-110 (HZI)]
MAANKRLLKKEIHRICGALAGECVLAKIAIPGIDREKLNEIIYQLADLQASALRLVSVEFPRTPRSFDNRKEYADARRAYFKASFAKLREHFNARVQEILKEMNATVPDASTPEQRKAQMKHILELGFAEESK